MKGSTKQLEGPFVTVHGIIIHKYHVNSEIRNGFFMSYNNRW